MGSFSFVQDIQPLSTFRGNVTGFIKQVQDTHRPLVITNHGRSAAVLLDVIKYEEIMERLELLQDIHLAESQLADGKGVIHSEAFEQALSVCQP
jgi:prevent-host-death family protein